MIQFIDVEFKNFLSYGDESTLFQLDSKGITVLCGVNGVGKSTIIEAVAYACYGKTLRESKKEDVINDRNNGGMLTTVRFTIDGSNIYKIERGSKPEVFNVYFGDKLLNKDSTSKASQQMIDEILNMNFFIFRQLVIQSKTGFKPFLEFDAKNRRDFIDRVYDLDVYRHMSKSNKDNIKIAQKTKSDLEKDLVYIESMINTRISHRATLVEHQETAESDAQIEFDKAIKDLEASLAEVSVLGKSIGADIKAIGGISAEVDNSDIRARVLEVRTKQFDVKRSGEDLTKLVKFFNDNDVCPTCTQVIKPQWKDSKITKMQAEISELKSNWVNITTELKELETASNELDKENREILLNNQKYKALEKTLSETRAKYKDINARLHETKEKGVQVRSHNLNILSIDNELTDYQEKLDKCKAELAKVTEELNSYLNAEILLKDDGLIATIIDESLPIINDSMNKYLGIMGIEMIFELNKTFVDTIYKTHGKTTSYTNLSEGQKLRVNLAMLLTWRDVTTLLGMNTTNIMFFDELFDSSLDANGIEAFLDILNEMNEMNIYIISHTPSKISADRVFTITTENSFSKINEV